MKYNQPDGPNIFKCTNSFKAVVSLFRSQIGSGRIGFVGPHYIAFDMSLLKRIPISERMKMEVRADATSFSNSTMFGAPTADITSTTFGRIRSSSTSSSRKIQLAAKFYFWGSVWLRNFAFSAHSKAIDLLRE